MTRVLNHRILHRLAPSTRAIRVLVAVAAVGLSTSACDVHGISGPGTVTSLTITPNPTTLAIGGTQQFTLVAKDFSGAIITPTSPTWSVAAGGGTIAQTGIFTAGTVPGAFANTVTATLDGVSATATVNVVAGPLASITVTPNPSTLAIGATQQFTAVGKDAAGNVVPIVPSWAIVAGGGSIDPTSGLFTAGNTAGAFANTVRASVGSIAGTATVNVTPGPLASITVTPNPQTLSTGATQQYTAVGRDAGGNVLTIAPTWSVANGGGTINAAGLFTAGNTVGTFANTITATSGTISGKATVTVTPVLTTIVVTPNPATVQANGTQQFSAAGFDAANNPLGITPVWSVVNGGGTINPNTGVFTAGTVAGTYTNTIKATSGTVSGFATVIVTVPPALATIIVTPNPDTLNAGGTQQFSAVGRDGNGNPFPIAPVWSVVNGGGTIDPVTGMFTAGNLLGTYTNTVQATSGTVSGNATVVIVAPAPPPPNLLGSAAPNGIMAGTAFTCVTNGLINANISISPGSTVTGFPPCVITGVQHLADAVAAQAQIDLTTAYNDLMGRPCPPANAITSDLGGTTKTAGVYCSATSIGVTGNLTLDGGGDPNATFIFQAGTALTTAGNILLINGAQAKNVYWVVGSSATIGTASQWKGNIVALTSITLVDNANLIGRALARNGAVSLGTNNVVTLP